LQSWTSEKVGWVDLLVFIKIENRLAIGEFEE